VVFFNERALLPTLAVALSLGALFSGDVAQAQALKPEKANFTLAIGGVSAQMYFLPVVLADRLGFFEEAGLKVNMINTGSGTKGLQAVVSGGAGDGDEHAAAMLPPSQPPAGAMHPVGERLQAPQET